MSYTEEQVRVIESNAQSVSVNAFAGTGKTTTLVGYAKARENERILYLAFNKPVADEAKGRFPTNVDAKTSHSLAFGRFGHALSHKLGNPKPFHVTEALNMAEKGDRATVLAGLALETLSRFMTSAKFDIEAEMVPIQKAMAASIDPARVHSVAIDLWKMMVDPKSSMIVPHDGYLKLYQLSEPNLERYDAILLDEAQDTNPCLFHIFNRQQSNKVLVGDEHQNIYSFRGSMNAMKHLRSERHSLTTSFRFGEPVAEVANTILGVFKNETQRLKGASLGECSVGRPKTMQTTFLHRTNAGLFDRAVDMMNHGVRIYYVGGIKNYNFNDILDVWYLMDDEKRKINDPFIRSFASFGALEDYADIVDDREVIARIKVVKKYTFKIPRLIASLEENEQQDPNLANATLTTAHKAKGKEWEQVILGDDFSETMLESGKPKIAAFLKNDEKALEAEEANLIYVAATRAKHNLVLNEDLQKLMKYK